MRVEIEYLSIRKNISMEIEISGKNIITETKDIIKHNFEYLKKIHSSFKLTQIRRNRTRNAFKSQCVRKKV